MAGEKEFFILLDAIEMPEYNMVYIFHWSPTHSLDNYSVTSYQMPMRGFNLY